MSGAWAIVESRGSMAGVGSRLRKIWSQRHPFFRLEKINNFEILELLCMNQSWVLSRTDIRHEPKSKFKIVFSIWFFLAPNKAI